MITTDYISNDETILLTLRDSIADAKTIFESTTISHISIVENGEFYGLIAEIDISSFDDIVLLNEIRFSLQSFYVNEDMVWLDILKALTINETNIIPVLSDQNKYLGYYELTDILHHLNSTPFLQNKGTILIISKQQSEYSISEIAQIVESNGAILHGLFISGNNGNEIEITVRLYSTNINDILHTFRRYDYNVILGVKEDAYLDDLKSKSDYLQKYLNI